MIHDPILFILHDESDLSSHLVPSLCTLLLQFGISMENLEEYSYRTNLIISQFPGS